jgi:pimeloyl-ACP methyl ester carboxylesterase
MDKSTNVRTWWGLAAARAAARVAPSLAARAGIAWFTRTRRRPEPPAVAVLRAEGQPFDLALDGVALRGRVWGRGPTVLLQHGWDGSVASFSAIIPALVAAGYRVVLTEGPGHGESGGSYATLVHFSRALSLTAALHGPIHAVVAHSLGAPAATLAMREARLDAARLILVAPAVDPAHWIRQLARRLGDEVLPAVEAEIARVADRPLDAVSLAAHLPHVDAPVLVVHDRSDRETPIAPVLALAEAHPRIRLHLTEGLGHTRILADPTVVRAVVDAVVGTRPAAPARAPELAYFL